VERISLLVYVDDCNLLAININAIQKESETVLDVNEVAGIEV
jgi:hypothetical protein